jgi:hypothetical protein
VRQVSRTPEIDENLVDNLWIAETEERPNRDGRSGIVGATTGSNAIRFHPWNAKAFRLPVQIFDITEAGLPKTSAPSVTISK